MFVHDSMHNRHMRESTRWFVVLAEESNVSAAADRLGMAQPTLSRMLARLERQVGMKLFDRHGRRITLNEVGREFLEHVRRADASLAMAEQVVREARGDTPRIVRFGFLHSFGPWLVPDIILRTRETDPRISFELHQGAAAGVTELLLADRIDLAIVSPRPDSPEVMWRLLQRQQMQVALPAAHPLAAARSVQISDLQDETFVSMSHGYGLRHILDEACASAGFEPRIALECQELGTVRGMVSAGVGVALVPVEESRPRAGVVTVALRGASAARDIGLIWHRGRTLPSYVRVVRDLARPLPDRAGRATSTA